MSKTEALTQAFRKAIGVRIKEETEVGRILLLLQEYISGILFKGPQRRSRPNGN
jgi:hypothetical protein